MSRANWDHDAEGYDAMRRRLVPCFDLLYGTALRLIEDWGTPRKVLDLGAGTGLFSEQLRASYPDTHFHLIDGSSGMLSQARRRFSDQGGITFSLGDMRETDLGGPWDIVVSALAIHHLDDDEKRALFQRIRSALMPGGLFVNVEQVHGPTSEAEDRYARFWLEQISALGVPEDEIGRAQERMSDDCCASMEEQLHWLREAGFSDVDCSFKAWRFAVLSGRV